MALRCFPEAAGCAVWCKSGGGGRKKAPRPSRWTPVLPLHLALVHGRRTWREGMSSLVKAEPRAVRVRCVADPSLPLDGDAEGDDLAADERSDADGEGARWNGAAAALYYPFQLAAISSSLSVPEAKMRLAYRARNRFSNGSWRSMSDRHKATEVARAKRERYRAEVGTVYELLRRAPELVSSGIVAVADAGAAGGAEADADASTVTVTAAREGAEASTPVEADAGGGDRGAEGCGRVVGVGVGGVVDTNLVLDEMEGRRQLDNGEEAAGAATPSLAERLFDAPSSEADRLLLEASRSGDVAPPSGRGLGDSAAAAARGRPDGQSRWTRAAPPGSTALWGDVGDDGDRHRLAPLLRGDMYQEWMDAYNVDSPAGERSRAEEAAAKVKAKAKAKANKRPASMKEERM
uniref:Uncharacterized protein n=1 Tax=Odontella aurita TaxID=265563 RepID=A0A6U6CT42_9STRA|mmetsp:Transcript_15888/g.45669  ORF Transcript_15888/g.45669 Transcript_15888/m.45669 type:complete len:406 (+) Transcript_15888:2501-3718(+)